MSSLKSCRLFEELPCSRRLLINPCSKSLWNKHHIIDDVTSIVWTNLFVFWTRRIFFLVFLRLQFLIQWEYFLKHLKLFPWGEKKCQHRKIWFYFLTLDLFLISEHVLKRKWHHNRTDRHHIFYIYVMHRNRRALRVLEQRLLLSLLYANILKEAPTCWT